MKNQFSVKIKLFITFIFTYWSAESVSSIIQLFNAFVLLYLWTSPVLSKNAFLFTNKIKQTDSASWLCYSYIDRWCMINQNQKFSVNHAFGGGGVWNPCHYSPYESKFHWNQQNFQLKMFIQVLGRNPSARICLNSGMPA